MNIFEVIEECHLYNDRVTDQHLFEITQCYSDRQIVDVSEFFVKAINKNHRVPGKIINTLWGINDYYRELKHLTVDQKMFVLGRVIANWDNLRADARASLML